jgi:peptide/nickel transport system permease protein
MAFATFGLSVPSFWLAILLILVFSVYLRVLPAGGALWSLLPLSGKLASLVLPSFSVGVMQGAIVARLTRSSVLDILTQEHVKVAQAKGLSWTKVVVKHVLWNAMVPISTVLGTIAIGIFGGLVVIETVFTLPGVGRLVVQAVLQRDYPVIQGTLLITAVVYSLLNLLVDLSYSIMDPRITYV